MHTPLGARVEWLVPDGPGETDRDPAGNTFIKTVAWEDKHLVSTFKSTQGLSDIVTRRYVEEQPDTEGRISDQLVQETSYQGITFTRYFRREAE